MRYCLCVAQFDSACTVLQSQSIILCCCKLVRLCMVVGSRSAYQGWRGLVGCRWRTTGKASKRVCLGQGPGLEGEGSRRQLSTEARNDRRSPCWGPSGRGLSRRLQFFGGCSPFLCAVAASVAFLWDSGTMQDVGLTERPVEKPTWGARAHQPSFSSWTIPDSRMHERGRGLW